jgi:hypothetical protein
MLPETDAKVEQQLSVEADGPGKRRAEALR